MALLDSCTVSVLRAGRCQARHVPCVCRAWGRGRGDAREKGGADEDGVGGAGDGAEGVLCHSSYAAGTRGVCGGLLLEVVSLLRFDALCLCAWRMFFICLARVCACVGMVSSTTWMLAASRCRRA